MDKTKIIGKYGEESAIKYLKKENYRIIKKNYRCKFGEIDIIAYDKNSHELVFIEVKTRTNKKFGTGINSIDIIKQKHIYKTIEYYLCIKKIDKKHIIRIDAIEIFLKKWNCEIKHYKNIIIDFPYTN